MEESCEGKLRFLDSLVYLDPEKKIQLEVYQKPTHTDHYLNFDSHHPLHQKLGSMKTLLHRLVLIVSEESKKHVEKETKSKTNKIKDKIKDKQNQGR